MDIFNILDDIYIYFKFYKFLNVQRQKFSWQYAIFFVSLDDKKTSLVYENSKKYNFTLENTKYPTSAKKIAEMREVLEKQRYVSFIN